MERIIEQLTAVCGRNRLFAFLNASTALFLALIFYVQLTVALISSNISTSQFLILLTVYYSVPGTFQLLVSYLIYRFCTDRIALLSFGAPILASLLNFFISPPVLFISEAYFLIVNFLYTVFYGWRRELLFIYTAFIFFLILSFPFGSFNKIFYLITLIFVLAFSTISGIAFNVFLRLLEINHYLDAISPSELKQELEKLFKRFFPYQKLTPDSVFKKKRVEGLKNPVVSIPLNHFLHKVSEKMKLLEEIERKERREREIIELLSIVEELKDPYTRGHSQNVAFYSEAIAKEMGLEEDETKTLRMAALLHDIGKLSVPDWVLIKPSPLSDKEFKLIKLHTVLGERILSRIEGFEEVAKVVRHHHEKIDGSGYPDGLKGEEIPLLSRIISVADIYDALTSDRPYRKALTPAEAIRIMEELPLDEEIFGVARKVLPGLKRMEFPVLYPELEELDRYKKTYVKRNFTKGNYPSDFCIFLIRFKSEEMLLSFLDQLLSVPADYIATFPINSTSQLVVCNREAEKHLLPLLSAAEIERIV